MRQLWDRQRLLVYDRRRCRQRSGGLHLSRRHPDLYPGCLKPLQHPGSDGLRHRLHGGCDGPRLLVRLQPLRGRHRQHHPGGQDRRRGDSRDAGRPHGGQPGERALLRQLQYHLRHPPRHRDLVWRRPIGRHRGSGLLLVPPSDGHPGGRGQSQLLLGGRGALLQGHDEAVFLPHRPVGHQLHRARLRGDDRRLRLYLCFQPDRGDPRLPRHRLGLRFLFLQQRHDGVLSHRRPGRGAGSTVRGAL